ncbi:hypothetical protein TNCV_1093461 [Trichonephila clavipes]|nr:hypothetical protein TNCV_1093461 [Trichonephila clavipes]
MIVQLRNEKVSNHDSTPITIDCNVVAFIVFEEGFHQPIKRTKQRRRSTGPFATGGSKLIIRKPDCPAYPCPKPLGARPKWINRQYVCRGCCCMLNLLSPMSVRWSSSGSLLEGMPTQVSSLSPDRGANLPEIPGHLSTLDLISERLISPRIPFVQIRRLRHVLGQFGILGSYFPSLVSVLSLVPLRTLDRTAGGFE